MLITSRESINNTNSFSKTSALKTYKDVSKENIFRTSSTLRISMGTLMTTTVCLFYSLAHARYRKFEFQFVKNWFKGSLTFSFIFYTGNELIFAFSNFYKLYTNFWINYTGLAYFLSRIHYRYMIRNHMMKWYLAIKYSHKCFLLFLVANLMIELLIFLTREIFLFEEKDVFDLLREKYIDKTTHKPNFNMTYKDVENNFMKPFHVFNSRDKVKIIKEHLRKSNQEKFQSSETHSNKNSSKGFLDFGIKTVNLYDIYKNKEI